MTWIIAAVALFVAWKLCEPWLTREMAKVRSENATDGKLRTWPGGESFNIDVVGESHYSESLHALMSIHPDRREIETVAVLIPYASKHDSDAVRVEVQGQIVGHLSRNDAKRYRVALKKKFGASHTATANARIGGSLPDSQGQRGPIGVRLSISELN